MANSDPGLPNLRLELDDDALALPEILRVPFLLSWPAGLPRGSGDSGLRHQYQYVTDLLPTLLDLNGIEHPGMRHGSPAKSVDGFRSAAAESTHPEQYVEFGGNRGYYSHSWKIVTNHRPGQVFDDAEWELYDVARDPTELHNVAADEPAQLEMLGTA